MAPERCLLTGATGFLGRTLTRRLLDKGFRVRLLSRNTASRGAAHADPHADRRADDPALDRPEAVHGDLRDPASLTGIATNIDTVYHLAGITHTNDARLYHDVNVVGTGNLLRECRRAGVGRFVYFGSRADHPDGGAYSRSKNEAAELVRQSGVPFTTLRIAEVYGRSGGGGEAGDGGDDGLGMVARLVERFPVVPVPGGDSFELCPVHVDDVVDAAIDVAGTDATRDRSYVIAGPECHSLRRILELALRHRGLSKRLVPVPVRAIRAAALLDGWIPGKKPFLVRDQVPRLASPKDSDISAARTDFGFEPRRLTENLDQLL